MGLEIGITLLLNPVMKHLTFSVFNTPNKCHFCIDLGKETFVKTKGFQEGENFRLLQKLFFKTENIVR